MFEIIHRFLTDNINCIFAEQIVDGIILFGIALVSVLCFYLTKVLLGYVEKLVSLSATTWDDDLLNSSMLSAISQLSPALIVRWGLLGFFGEGENAHRVLQLLTSLYIIGAVVWILIVLMRNLYDAFLKRPKFRAYAIKGIFQMFQLVIICVAVILAISLIVGRSPAAILTALGASAAVLMLVFKDTILGLVASVQLTANDMIHRGDWIICDKHDANGEVEEISLTTIKVRNWDNSITTIPPYSLISESFRNYQPMRLSGGRRVDRSILIDANSVRFCTREELDILHEKGWLEGLAVDKAARQINLHLLRSYLERWLTTNNEVNNRMLLMVRQMEPTAAGLPLQLYFFTKVVEWKQFERVQSDIFDHVYAIIGEFGLRIFQTPAGNDIAALRK